MIKYPKINKYYQDYNTEHYIIKKNCKTSTSQYNDPINLNIIQRKKVDKKKDF